MEMWAESVMAQLSGLTPRPSLLDLPHGPEACLCNDPIPGVAAPMNDDYGVQVCEDCRLYTSDLMAAWALAQHVGGVVRYVRWTGDDDDPEGGTFSWVPDADGPADIIATGTDPWVEVNGMRVDWTRTDLWAGVVATKESTA